ncbi:N-acetyltransferase [Saliniramus sp.]|uniref:GNAT family N-acetyltransferase n=1 Tax=Saliniramus sp. TaxID=2986772 RepID=UPI002CA64BFF|nr:N-acetyltransferase [Saliniramus sp.]HMB09073.1 N-acetyltransferase [Saliniramus sp.]
MEFTTDYENRTAAVADLFTATFTATAGAQEGALIGKLVRRLMAETPEEDIRVFLAVDDGVLVGGIFFSRLSYERDTRAVFVLGPVAVATERQRRGIGQELIAYGLERLRREGMDIAVTYGDPDFYGRIGFKAITQADIPAPFALQYPEGWLGLSLTDTAAAPMGQTPLAGAAHCVAALDDPVFW